MRILKTFESFFNYFVNSKVTNTKEVWGYTREDIEDLFIEFHDRYDLPISISFITKNKMGGTTVSVSDKDLNTIKRGVLLFHQLRYQYLLTLNGVISFVEKILASLFTLLMVNIMRIWVRKCMMGLVILLAYIFTA